MTLKNDIRLRHLLDAAISEAYSNLDPGPAIIDEILPVIGQRLYDVESTENVYEKYLVELSIGRIRDETLQLDNFLNSYFEKVPESLAQNIYEIDFDGSQRPLSQEDWEFAKSYCRSFILTNHLVPLFNMVNEVLKIRTAELISRNVFDKKYGCESGTNWLLENKPLSASQRPEFLMRCNIIKPDLKNDIQEVMDYRNELIHEMGRWSSLEPPEEIREKLELAVSTVESVDTRLSYPPQVRLHRELEPNQAPLDVDLDRVRSSLSERERFDFEAVVDVVEDELLRSALINEDSPYHDEVAEIFSDDKMLIEAFERIWQDELQDADEEEIESILLPWAGFVKKRFDVNVFSAIRKEKKRFQSRLPSKFLTEEFEERFEDNDFSDVDFIE